MICVVDGTTNHEIEEKRMINVIMYAEDLHKEENGNSWGGTLLIEVGWEEPDPTVGLDGGLYISDVEILDATQVDQDGETLQEFEDGSQVFPPVKLAADRWIKEHGSTIFDKAREMARDIAEAQAVHNWESQFYIQ